MKRSIDSEISRNDLSDIPIKLPPDTSPLLTAFECLLMERFTGRSYVYSIENIFTGQKETLARRQMGVTPSGINSLVEKIRDSEIAGSSIYEAERPIGNGITYDKAIELTSMVFTDVLPIYGYNPNVKQLSYALHIMDAIYKRIISLAEYEAGADRTIAYLISAIIAKVGRLNDYCNLSFYANVGFIDLHNMPIVIAASSFAKQKEIVEILIPALSKMLMEFEIIRKPVTAVLRKGREHFVCENRLRGFIQVEQNQQLRETLINLLKPCEKTNLSQVKLLSSYVKEKICVPERCGLRCKYRKSCSYLRMLKDEKSYDYDIQVCSHKYFISDIQRRKEMLTPLLPNYQIAIIDEAHNFNQAARSMYGVELSNCSIPHLRACIRSLSIRHERADRDIKSFAKMLEKVNRNLFRYITKQAVQNKDLTENKPTRLSITIDYETERNLCNIESLSHKISEMLTIVPVILKDEDRKIEVLSELKQVQRKAAELGDNFSKDNYTCWIEKRGSELRLCATPKNLGDRLYNDIWNIGIPTILTSGALSDEGNFSRIKKSLGLNRVGSYRMDVKSFIHQ